MRDPIMKKPFAKLFPLLLAATLTLPMAALRAQEGGAEPAEGGITQGEAAQLLARRLGFFVGTTKPMDQKEAVKVLLENGIIPADSVAM